MFEELLRRIREVQNFPDGPVALHAPIFAGNEKRYVMDAIESTFVSSVGEYVTRFEEMLCSLTAHGMPWLAARHLCLGNGSAACRGSERRCGPDPASVVRCHC